MVDPDDKVNWPKFSAWVKKTRAEHEAFIKEHCKDGETWCIYCETAVKVEDCDLRQVEDSDEAHKAGHPPAMGFFCPKCDRRIHDYTL
jgi:hypothetical protein